MLYALTLRHHAGRFYLACTNVADEQGNFIVSTTDPTGGWSDAVWVDAEAFDPSLCFAVTPATTRVGPFGRGQMGDSVPSCRPRSTRTPASCSVRCAS